MFFRLIECMQTLARTSEGFRSLRRLPEDFPNFFADFPKVSRHFPKFVYFVHLKEQYMAE